MNEAEYDLKNYGDRGGCYHTLLFTPSSISIIFQVTDK